MFGGGVLLECLASRLFVRKLKLNAFECVHIS